MKDFTVDNLTEAVVTAYTDKTKNPRMRQIFEALIRHLHGFAREVELTEQEWMQAIEFLTATGQKCDDKRQEFILLSDTLGLSMMVDAINHPKGGKGTEGTVLGPFFVSGAPKKADGADLRLTRYDNSVPCVVNGRVVDADGKPLAGATIDVWQTAANGLYDIQDPEIPQWNLRGQFTSLEDGSFNFVTEKPVSYPVPTDGPVGQMLRAAGRHAYRPAHIHFIIAAPGYDTLVTHIFAAGDEYLDSDAVFATKSSLVDDFPPCDPALAREYGVEEPCVQLRRDFGLMPLADSKAA